MLHPWMTLRVAAKRREADDIFGFELVDPDGRELPPFTAGAHLDVEVAEGLVRQYSLCGPPGRRDRYQIAVLREPQSRGGSRTLHDRIEAGQLLRVSEPRNHFELEPAAPHSVLIAGGIGITPILSMAERLHHAGQAFVLHYAARSPGRAAFRERLAAAPFADRVRFHFGEQRLDLSAVLADPPPGAHLYVCGPAGLIEAALQAAEAHGWPASHLHREFFTPPAPPEDQGDPEAFQVKLASTGQVLGVPADRTIVSVLAENGVEVPVSCEQGVCGTCLTRVLDGRPDHRDVFLTPEEQAQNDQMTLCCSRALTPLLVLDL